VVTRKRHSRRGGAELHTVEYWPAMGRTLRGAVLFHHGLAEHCGRYSYGLPAPPPKNNTPTPSFINNTLKKPLVSCEVFYIEHVLCGRRCIL
jgi:hypothetical protein